ncbi:MAG: hypothetical protein JSW39_02005 [Desulfobacterales bacterium]|nr:MAG: hypothetical protein JSW39_02005 [Desulfobacterales bacterium]
MPSTLTSCWSSGNPAIKPGATRLRNPSDPAAAKAGLSGASPGNALKKGEIFEIDKLKQICQARPVAGWGEVNIPARIGAGEPPTGRSEIQQERGGGKEEPARAVAALTGATQTNKRLFQINGQD